MYKSIFSKNNTDDSRTVVESKGITYLPLDLSSKQSEEKETYKNPLEWFFSNWDSLSNSNSEGVSYEGYSPRYEDSSDIDTTLYKNYPLYQDFENNFYQSGVSQDRLPFFAKLAEKESGFNPTIRNTAGYPAWGYFQFMDGTFTDSHGKTRSWSNIRDIANVSVEEFLNNPILQIQSADKLANKFLASFNSEDKRLAREKGYSDSALVAGAWLAGAGGVKRFLRGNGNPSDVHGTTVEQRMKEFNNYFKKGGILKFDGGGYLSRNAAQYNRSVSNGMPFGHLPTNITKHQIKLANSADNKDHENEIVVRNLSKEIQKIIDKWGDAMFSNGVSYDFNYDTPEGIGLRMLNYYESSGYSPRSTRDTIRFVNDEQMRYTTNGFFDSNGNPVITYNDPNNIYNRYSTGFINDMLQLFYGVSKKRFGGIIKKYNTGGPISWTLSDEWHAPLLPSYVNSKPDASDNVSGFNNAKEVYEYILSLPGSNPAIAAGWTGVFMKESSLDHNAVNKSSGAKGIAQLLGSRRKEYMRWLNGRPDTWQNQISWVWEKVNNGVDDWQVYYDALKDKVDRGIKLSEDEASHWNSMKNSKYRNYSFQNYRDKISTMDNPGDIAELMTWTFERPGNKEAHIDQRRGYANNVYNQFNYDNNFGQWSWE